MSEHDCCALTHVEWADTYVMNMTRPGTCSLDLGMWVGKVHSLGDVDTCTMKIALPSPLGSIAIGLQHLYHFMFWCTVHCMFCILYYISTHSIWVKQGSAIVNFVLLTCFTCFTCFAYLKFHYTHNGFITATFLVIYRFITRPLLIFMTCMYVCMSSRLSNSLST